MKAITLKKFYLNNRSYFSVFGLLFFFASCKGQDKEVLPKDKNDPIKNQSETSAANTLNKSILEQYDGEAPDPLFYIDGQLCQHLRKIHQDKKGNLWFGTNVYGLMRFDGDSLEYFKDAPGVGKGRITGILEDKKGNVWFGTYGGLTKYDGRSFTNYSKKDGLIHSEIWSLAIDGNDTLWIGTINGIYKFDGTNFTSFSIPKAKVKNPKSILSPNRITSILEDRNGVLWFGTDGYGITKYDGNSFTHITTKDGLSNNNIMSILEDKKGHLWIGTMFGGLSHFDGKKFNNYTKDGVIKGVEVSALYEDNTGDIWFASEGYGVYRYDGKSFTNLHKKEGLKTNGILSIFQDKKGHYWFGGWGGLFRFNGNSFYSVTKDGPWD